MSNTFSGVGRNFPRAPSPAPALPLVTDLHSICVFTVGLTCFNVENIRGLTQVLYVFLSVQRIFRAKFFSLENLFLLTNFQNLFAVSSTVTIVAHIFNQRCYACSTVVIITYCRDGRLIYLKGHFENAAFS